MTPLACTLASGARACNAKGVIWNTFGREHKGRTINLTYKQETLWNDHAPTEVVCTKYDVLR